MTSPDILKYNTYPTKPNEVPIHLPDKYYDMLMEICPHFINYTVDDEAPKTFCCNTSQIEILKNNFVKIDTTFNKCPACQESMKKMWCDFTCSNHQADYVQINGFIPPENEYIKEARFTLTPEFQDDFWQCCKRNVLGTVYIENLYVNIRAFLPGIISEQQPPPNPLVGFKFLNQDEKYEIPGYVGNTTPCETSCTCQYCEASCNNPKYRPLVPDFSCRMFGVPCYIAFAVGATIMIILVLCACSWGLVTKIVRGNPSDVNQKMEDEDDLSTTISDTCINNETSYLIRKKK